MYGDRKCRDTRRQERTERHGDRKYRDIETGNTEIHGDRKYRDT
jgi:hypothetical protein